MCQDKLKINDDKTAQLISFEIDCFIVCELEYINMCPPNYRVYYATETEFLIIGS